MITGFSALLLFLLWRYPQLPVARGVHALIVAPLAARLNRVTRRQLIFWALVAVFALVAGEWLAILGPLDMGLVLLWDVALYVDALLGAVAVASVARLVPLPRWRPRPRARRSAPRRAAPGNDADAEPALWLRAA
ncbi:MAG: hypothetical protein A4S12_05270 [Proteobacteria bacterium SG_bin5]|nr:hypothetical protein [Sphingomonas sp.]OQW43279.1 MAG: hypothetical protein A4S12_05270 [Proteobacteria bacterium SG_bin5]